MTESYSIFLRILIFSPFPHFGLPSWFIKKSVSPLTQFFQNYPVFPFLPFQRASVRGEETMFFETQLGYCPLVLIIHGKDKIERLIIYLHERSLPIFYEDYNSCFKDILTNNKFVYIHYRNIPYLAIQLFRHPVSVPRWELLDSLGKWKLFKNFPGWDPWVVFLSGKHH